MSSEGKVAIVTGGAKGIGFAVVRALARSGTQVVAVDADGQRLERAVAELRADGLTADPVAADISDPAAVSETVAGVLARRGRIDILVNNAGIGRPQAFLDTTLENWNRVLAVNLTGAFLVAQACARAMAERRAGRIVNITSISGVRGGQSRAAYGASKAGLDNLTKVMAVELAPLGINVNAVAPGPVETEMVCAAHDEATRAAYARLIPSRRYAAPEEIAGVVQFLVSDAAAHIHGHTVFVDGGFNAAGVMLEP